MFNYTQGYLTSFIRNTTSGDPVTIKIADLNVSGVDDKRIVVRYDNFGDLVASNLTVGEVTFISPGQKTEYDTIKTREILIIEKATLIIKQAR